MSRRNLESGLRPNRLHRARLYERIVEQLKDFIREDGLGAGDRLPGERDLAQSLGVSRASVSQALVALEVLGVVSVRHGDGVVINEQPDETLLSQLRQHEDSMPDIIDARSALETKLAALAARRRTEADLARIDAALLLMEQEITAGARGIEGDEAFHEAVTQAGHSPLLGRLMGELRQLILGTRIESLSQSGRPETSLQMHRDIAEAIRRQDPEAAGSAMQHHITVVSDVAFVDLEQEELDARPR